MPTPCQAIRKKCINCSGSSLKEVRDCEIYDCPLHQFRMGKNPNRRSRKNNPNLVKKVG